MLIAAAAALELERTAAAYRGAAKVLKGVPDQAQQYLAELDKARQVHWHSEAGEAFRTLVEGLRYPGNILSVEAAVLAGEAETIAADLSSYAETARQLGNMVAVLSAVDLTALAQDLGAHRLETLRSSAAEAAADAGRFMRYMQENGGIPWLLQEAAGRLW